MKQKTNTTEQLEANPRTPTPGAFIKPTLSTDTHKRYKATRVRYPSIREDGTFWFSFTSTKPGSESGKGFTRQCTKAVFEKVHGRFPGNDTERTPVGGYAQTTGRTFYVYENNTTGIVDAISTGPSVFFNSKQAAPVVLKDRRTLETTFCPATGGFETVFMYGPEMEWLLPSMPGDTKAAEFEKLVQKIDQASELYPGLQITPEFMVSVVAGNRVTFAR